MPKKTVEEMTAKELIKFIIEKVEASQTSKSNTTGNTER